MGEQQFEEFGEWERLARQRCAIAYAGSLGDLTRGSVGSLLDATAVGPGTRVLDVGTGPGFVAQAATERGAFVRAVDQSAAMVQIGRTGGVDAVQSSAERLPFDADAFDAAVGGYLLNHLPRPRGGGRRAATSAGPRRPAGYDHLGYTGGQSGDRAVRPGGQRTRVVRQ